MIQSAVTTVVSVLVVFALCMSAFAQDTNPFGAGTDQAVEFRADATYVSEFEAVTVAERPHVEHSSNPASLPCARQGIISSDGEGNVNYGCVAYYYCGGERIDDVYTGVLSGTDATGAYAEFLASFGDLAVAFGPNTGAEIDLSTTLDDLNDTFLDAGFNTPVDDLALPIFYYCREGAGGSIEIIDPTYGPSFGWDTTVDAEYDIVTLSNQINDELFALLDAAPPQVRMTPPIETGVTIVNFPSWFWVNEPSTLVELYAESDRQTILVQGRATLSHIEWRLGDTTLECTLEQMLAFDENDHHPANDRPFCSHVFDTLDEWNLQATAHYDIEQQVTRRITRSGAFVAQPWEPHPTTPTYLVTTDAGTMQTRPIYSVNVVADIEG